MAVILFALTYVGVMKPIRVVQYTPMAFPIMLLFSVIRVVYLYWR